MSGLTIRVKRGSRGSATLLEAANRILKLLGVSSTKRGKQPSPKSKVRSTAQPVCYLSFNYASININNNLHITHNEINYVKI